MNHDVRGFNYNLQWTTWRMKSIIRDVCGFTINYVTHEL